MRGDTTMSVKELQALAQKFADAFDQRDLQPILDMLPRMWKYLTTFPTGSMARRSLPNISTRSSRALPQPASASGNHRVACTAIRWVSEHIRNWRYGFPSTGWNAAARRRPGSDSTRPIRRPANRSKLAWPAILQAVPVFR